MVHSARNFSLGGLKEDFISLSLEYSGVLPNSNFFSWEATKKEALDIRTYENFAGALFTSNMTRIANASASLNLVKSKIANEELITVYRGINSETGGIAYENALKGIVKPRGSKLFGHSDALKHNTGLNGTIDSRFTSWTTDVDVVLNYAYRTNGEGILLKMTIPKSKLFLSPDAKEVILFHKKVKVRESEWLFKGSRKNINFKKVNL